MPASAGSPKVASRHAPLGLGRRAAALPRRIARPRRGREGIPRPRPVVSADGPVAEETSVPGPEQLMQETISFLKEDLTHLFDEQGIDASRYDEVVEFRDPISSYNSIRGYLFNIQFLRRVFSPTFELHDIRQTGDFEITSRWTMTMEVAPTKGTILRQLWDPKLVFTGVSIYGLNPSNGKINKHLDLWDAIDQQEFFSVEGFAHVLRQVFNLTRAPDLETPEFKVLKKKQAYEIREYPSFLVAETSMDVAKAPGAEGSVNPAGAGNNAFNKLAGYIFGKNEQEEKMAMTTPVLTTNTGRMQFVVGQKYKEAGMPTPSDKEVATKEAAGGLYIVSSFNGPALEDQVEREFRNLKSIMYRDGLVAGEGWVLARYNDPFTNPLLRRNEVLIPVAGGFSLW
ncbi:unnamed protein product [Ostreobium quekettii]|uniref:SOUL heme-binding protein n=1 Tax=Ostreobium quekettii TaxID=121088 RepID=A0A8S1IY21_9CHLO|nr:unnamed protein product [Ostreobium quekettii]